MYSNNAINQNIFSSCKRFHTQLVWVFFTIESDSALKIFNACANFTKSFFLDFSHSTSQSWCFTSPLKKKAKMQLKLWEIRKIVLWLFFRNEIQTAMFRHLQKSHQDCRLDRIWNIFHSCHCNSERELGSLLKLCNFLVHRDASNSAPAYFLFGL